MASEPRIERLRGLIAQAIELRDATRKLIAEVNEHLHLAISTADDRGARAQPRPDRRKKPRR